MSIQGPWVGSSALAETGQNWMSSAAGVVKVGSPFWLSSLIGKSKSNVTITVGKVYSGQYGVSSATYYGYSIERSGVCPANGSISQNAIGVTTLSVREVAGKDAGWMYLNTFVDRSWTVTFDDGASWVFSPVKGLNYYVPSNLTSLIAYLKARIGWTIGIQIS